MKLNTLVHHSDYGRGLVTKISPSKSLVEVNFNHFGLITVLNYCLTIIPTN